MDDGLCNVLPLIFKNYLIEVNAYSIKLTVLKWTTQWHLVPSQFYAPIAKYFHLPNGNPIPIKQSLPTYPSFFPLATTKLLSVFVDLSILDILHKWIMP